MYICICKGITDTQIRDAVANSSHKNFGQLKTELGLASQCGKCATLAEDVYQQSLDNLIEENQLFYAAS